MTGVTHGADAERLREVADALRGHGQRVKEIGDRIGPIAQVLEGPVEFQNELARECTVHQDNYRGHQGKVTSTGTD